MTVTLILIGSALIGGFIGAFLGYIVMYNAWRTDQDEFFDRLDKKNGIKWAYVLQRYTAMISAGITALNLIRVLTASASFLSVGHKLK